MHGSLTWWKVRRQLRRPLELPANFSETLKNHLLQIPKQSAAATAPGPASMSAAEEVAIKQ